MARSTISMYYAGQVYLGTGAFGNGLTVTATGTVAGGVTDSPTLLSASITNDGTITGGTDFAAAIWLQSYGVVRNDGVIAGDSAPDSSTTSVSGDAGIVLAAGGKIFNSGSITGGNGGAGNQGGSGGAGVILDGQCTLLNNGQIVGGYGGPGENSGSNGDGLDANGQDRITNFGTIAGGSSSKVVFTRPVVPAGVGVNLAEGGHLGNWGIIAGSPGQIAEEGGGIGGVGVLSAAASDIVNVGLISGGAGGFGGHIGGSGGTGVAFTGSAGDLKNFGSITGGAGGGGAEGRYGGTGVDLGASVALNEGLINGGAGGNNDGYDIGGTGGIGVSVAGGTLTNKGSIYAGAAGQGVFGEGGIGVNLSGGSVINTGLVEGGSCPGTFIDASAGGAGAVLTVGTLFNSGTITGGAGGVSSIGGSVPTDIGGAGVVLFDGILINAGMIAGGAGGTITSTGVTAASGAAVLFGSVAATLVVDPHAQFIGQVVGNTETTDTVMLAGRGTGTISGFGSQFTGISVYEEAAGANWVLTGVNAIGSGASFAIAGNLQVTGSTLVSGASTVAAGARVTSSGSLSFLGTLGNQGTLEASHGTLSISAVSGTGLLEIGTSSTLALLDGAPPGQAIDFLGPDGTLSLSALSSFAAPITGFGFADKIDLVSTAATSLTLTAGVLDVMNGTSTVATLTLDGAYTQGDFTLASDGAGGSLIVFK